MNANVPHHVHTSVSTISICLGTCVFKGELLEGGISVAVKRINRDSVPGIVSEEEIKVWVLSSDHVHLYINVNVLFKLSDH